MRKTCLLLSCWGLAAVAMAQPPGSAVQLPTFSNFSASSTVSVPDGGSTYLGGVNRASSGRSEFGVPLLPFSPFRNSAIGSQRSASSMRVTATIHDFEAMDEFLLSQPTEFRRQQNAAAAVAGRVALRMPNRSPAWDSPAFAGAASDAAPTAADLQAQRAAQRQARNDEAEQLYQRGLNAEDAGKANVAKVYYQMASRRASGKLKDAALARLAAIAQSLADAKVAQGNP